MELVELHRTDETLEADARELRHALSELIRVYGFRDRERICCHDVSVTQCHALDALVAAGPLTLNDLAARLYLDKSTASRVVDGLERKGYAARRPNPESRRSILVEATAEGTALCRRIEAELLGEEIRLLEEIPSDVRRQAAKLVTRLARAAAARVDTSGGTCCSVT
jgi:MarR family transcriptional regulator, 2-MHQ and catechol-resistance regulon repressor